MYRLPVDLLDAIAVAIEEINKREGEDAERDAAIRDSMLLNVPMLKPNEHKYEYHIDHTDCIWYRPEARNRCPVTCAQYRDGWNDAMNYVFRDGKGYRPYRRDQKWE